MISTSCLGGRPGGNRLIAPTPMKLAGVQFQRLAADTITDFYTAWDWAGFIKPQIDRIKAAGANAVKWASSAQLVTLGSLSQTLMNARIGQFVAYCQTVGLYVYWTITDGRGGEFHNQAEQTVNNSIVSVLDSYPNVVGIDMWNEGPQASGISTVVAWLQTYQTQIRARTSLPLTVSISPTPDLAIIQALQPYVDFYDFHPYGLVDGTASRPSTTDFNTLRASGNWKPWIQGECGSQSAWTNGQQQAGWQSLADLVGAYDCYGSFFYASQDGTTDTSLIKLYDSAAPPVARARLLTPLTSISQVN